MKIPKQFILHCHVINVIEKEYDTEGTRYGYYDSVREEIVIFNKIKINGDIIELSQVQIEASFMHELIHAIQWHSKGEFNEQEAQTYAELLLEFIKTSGVKIDFNVINESNEVYNE